MADWEGVCGRVDCGLPRPLPRPPHTLLPLAGGWALPVKVEVTAPNTDKFLFPGEQEVPVLGLVAVPCQADRQQRHEVTH